MSKLAPIVAYVATCLLLIIGLASRESQSPPTRPPGACSLYVAPSARGGSDRNSGTSIGSPRLRPRRLPLVVGSTVCFRGGTYPLQDPSTGYAWVIDFAGVTLRPFGSERVTLRGALNVNQGADDFTMKHLRLDGPVGATDVSGMEHVAPIIKADNATITGNEITNHHQDVSACLKIAKAPSSDPPSNFKITGNSIHGCGVAGNVDHGIYINDADSGTIARNLIYDNANRGIQLRGDVDNLVISDNVIDGNPQGILLGSDHGGSDAPDGNTIVRNTITNTGVADPGDCAGACPFGYALGVYPRAFPGRGNVAKHNCLAPPTDARDGAASPAGQASDLLRSGRSQGLTFKHNTVVADPGFVAPGALRGARRLAAGGCP